MFNDVQEVEIMTRTSWKDQNNSMDGKAKFSEAAVGGSVNHTVVDLQCFETWTS